MMTPRGVSLIKADSNICSENVLIVVIISFSSRNSRLLESEIELAGLYLLTLRGSQYVSSNYTTRLSSFSCPLFYQTMGFSPIHCLDLKSRPASMLVESVNLLSVNRRKAAGEI